MNSIVRRSILVAVALAIAFQVGHDYALGDWAHMPIAIADFGIVWVCMGVIRALLESPR